MYLYHFSVECAPLWHPEYHVHLSDREGWEALRAEYRALGFTVVLRSVRVVEGGGK